MKKEDLKKRFFAFAVSIVHYSEILPNRKPLEISKDQIIRSASSSACNYRAVCRAKSDADFVNKLKIVEEELDETLFWLEFIRAIEKTGVNENLKLSGEGDELLAIIVSTIKTSRNKIYNKP